MTLDDFARALETGDRFTIKHAAGQLARQSYEKGYLNGVQDQQLPLRYALDTGPLTTPVAWFRFEDDAKLACATLGVAWEDLRVVDIRKEAPTDCN